ncbi:penicillin-insensitive murein endopeptidase [Terrihabitans sp. B22-R8]|uniref:penicillin-insensitive murein endopeptidase n=1 Tax=Terrihabitans sp. B22-R8 TaxID=3425128 RepID=UPI00403C048A
MRTIFLNLCVSAGFAFALCLAGGAGAQAVPEPVQKPAGLNMRPLDPATAPAKQLFGYKSRPADLQARSIGSYAKGCLAGARPLPISGPAWQVMRLSRNRNWGHPALIAQLEMLGEAVQRNTAWPGLLVGDLSQPRGGPMLTGHASHQIGLDADVWLNPMPARLLTAREREEISAVSLVAKDWMDVDPKIWTPEHLKVIRLAATLPGVERIFVNPAIKKALCREAGGNRAWLNKVRPWWGHNYHMHIRLACPPGMASCKPQAPVPPGDGCDDSLASWFKKAPPPKPVPPVKPSKPKPPPPPMRLGDMPDECRLVLDAADAGFLPALASGAASAPDPEIQADTPMPTGQDTPVPPIPQ